MNQQYIILLITLSSFLSCKSDINKINIGEFDKNNYWQQDKYLNLNRLRQTPIDSIIDYLEYYGTLESIYGNVKTAQRIMDSVQILRNDIYNTYDGTIKHFQPKDAIYTISKLVRDKNLVLINEAHHRPEHQIFTTQLLKKLYQQGFEYLALEGLSLSDSLLQKRGYPNEKSGIYIQNTAYANLIRTALKLNIKVIAYDVFGLNNNERDSLQAVNIYQQSFAQNPKAKVVVHAGYGHSSKQFYENINMRPMGFVLSKMTQTEAFSINQTEVIEHQMPSQKDKNYQAVIGNYKFENCVVLESSKRFWVSNSGFDLNVIHPPVEFINHRPKYLVFNNYQAFDLPKAIQKKQYLNHLVKVFKANEPNSAVPIDQFEFVNFDMKIIVPKGEYRIEICDVFGKVGMKKIIYL